MTAACAQPNLGGDAPAELFRLILARLEHIEHRLALNIEKEAYTVDEAAERLSRAAWTVRQWCNKGQVPGARKVHGKGRQGEWRIPHESLIKLQNEGPLKAPSPK